MIWLSWLRSISVLWLLMLLSSVCCSIPITRPGCNESCGGVKIPFPFGIGPGCHHDPWYEITCMPPEPYQFIFTAAPYLTKFSLVVLNISSCLDSNACGRYDLTLEVLTPWQLNASTFNLGESPFSFSADQNGFVVRGCPGYATLMDQNGKAIGGCSSICEAGSMTAGWEWMKDTPCEGLGCCLISLYAQASLGFDFYRVHIISTTAEDTSDMTVKPMSWLSVEDLYRDGNYSGYYEDLSPTVLYWRPPTLHQEIDNCQNTSGVICATDRESDLCICTCSNDHRGNPYLPYGCRGASHFLHDMSTASATLLGLTLCMGTMLLLISGCGIYYLARRRRQIKQRAEFMKRIDGRLLDQQMSTAENAIDRRRLFTANELEKATGGFNANRILGQGGQGTVYKGMLPDGRVVAVKKSMKVDESQLEQFTNEVIILSQLNHRNVVKLLGCCLEMEVPLLVYEFIPNGTLARHIHNPGEDFPITWRTRLRIAVESAAAIAYLHSSSAMPIYHRDIKSSNILLDEQNRANVSDFGISRTIMIDQTHLTTCVQGTFGYLDPEYFRSNQFTEKSDIYSFGVVLAELLTSKKPVSPPDQSVGWKNLATEFLLHMENSTLFDFVDARVLKEAKEKELLAVANVAMQCLNSTGKQRPTMKEVANALEGIRSQTASATAELCHSKGDDVVMDMSNVSSGYMTSRSFFGSENGIGSSYSVEIQPLKHNTM